ncbi:DUF3081 family protein [bacterium SCSIO 12696]|nr:DUF3081 family protein [bacterium SCSIO 12696]
MSGEIDIRVALRAFNKITTDGDRIDDKYHLNGLTAYTDFDGYTVSIQNDFVSLTVFFHNKFSFKYTNNKEKIAFLEKLNVLGKKSQ